MSREHEYIDIDAFDREYGLCDLLPLKGLKKIIEASQLLLPFKFSVHTPDGTCYFSDPPLEKKILENVRKAIETHPALEKERETTFRIMPFTYELETMGYIALFPIKTNIKGIWDIPATQNLLSVIFHQMMVDTHKTIMTSGLHGKVVEESFDALKEKANALEISEEKYRNLAENLEIEVQKKTQNIKKAQITLMQKEKLASVGQLSAGIAHEINNPMGFIISNFHTLKNYVDDLLEMITLYHTSISQHATGADFQKMANGLMAEEKEKDLDYIKEDLPTLFDESLEGAERIKKIVSDLKTFARPSVTQKESVDLNKSIESILGILEHRIKAGVTIEKNLTTLPKFSCHAKDIHHLILNIILNAIDAIKERGTIFIQTKSDGAMIHISIEDNGVGIPEGDLPKVYDPFFTTKKIGQGMGLGLYGAYNTLKQYDGRIEIESIRGEKTRVDIFLPHVTP